MHDPFHPPQDCDFTEPLLTASPSAANPSIEASPLSDYDLDAYTYDLPEALIAQNPVVPRDAARLLVVGADPNPAHHVFRALPTLLTSGDLLVLNNTKVFPARLFGRKEGGLKVEVLLLSPQGPDRWLALVKPGRRLQPGTALWFSDQSPDTAANWLVKATILDRDQATGGRILQFELLKGDSLTAALTALGQIPFPPYVTASQASPDQYQTVYAQTAGAVAAPTAGLHFTPELLDRLQDHDIDRAFVTLHVGVGTFRPVNTSDIRQHTMHEEWIEVPDETVQTVNQTVARGGRVIAVGTTVVRALESAAQTGTLQPFVGQTRLFIYPGYQWQIVQGLITNFHLPGSSLLMMVGALIGRERLLALYQIAIESQYRFYSFGDAMLILPDATCTERSC
jgi:S-adenosylmethionine:tRNA ribosyltransferase-isomerase